MNNQILADYYEEKGFTNKSLRLRKRTSVVVYGYHTQYIGRLLKNYKYGYPDCYHRSGYIYRHGFGYSYTIMMNTTQYGRGDSYWFCYGWEAR